MYLEKIIPHPSENDNKKEHQSNGSSRRDLQYMSAFQSEVNKLTKIKNDSVKYIIDSSQQDKEEDPDEGQISSHSSVSQPLNNEHLMRK